MGLPSLTAPARASSGPRPSLAARPSLLRGLWLDTSSCPAGRSMLATPTVPAAPPGRPEQADPRWDHPAGADRQPSSTGGGGLPPYHPDNRCPRRYSSLPWACALSFGEGSPAAPTQRGRRHLPRHRRDRQTHHAHTLPAPRPFLQRAGLGRAHSGTVRPPPGPAVTGGIPRGGPGSGARPLGGPRGESPSPAPGSYLAGAAAAQPWSRVPRRLRAGLGEPAPSVSPSARTAPVPRPQRRLGRAGPAGRGGAGPLSSAAAMGAGGGGCAHGFHPGSARVAGTQLRRACRCRVGGWGGEQRDPGAA